MSPIRVGVVGLSAKNPALGPGAWAAVAILPSLQSNPAFEIVALCNSSVEAAQRSIEFHKLSPSVKAYGDINEIAQDPDVDLVLVSVHVSQHLALALPAIQNKKQVFVEWPLGASTEETEQLTQLAEANNLKTVVGVQGRGNPIVRKAKEIIQSGEIGDIKSTFVVGAFPGLFDGFWLEGIEGYLDIKSGGNSFHITFAHFLDSFTSVVGDLALNSISSILKNDVTEIEIRKMDMTTVVNPAYPKTAPDHVLVQGQLQNTGAPASISFRTTKSKEDIGIRWIISGSKGEIEITSGRGQWQIDSADKKLRVRLNDGEVRDVEVTTADLGVAAGISDKAVNTALILDAFAKGETAGFADFAAALKNHKLLDQILNQSGYMS